MKRLIATIAAAVGLASGVHAASIDLSTLTGDKTLADGDVVTGDLAGNFKISIADGATVKLERACFYNGENETGMWAGLTCLGNATIIIESANIAIGFHENYPGIYVPAGKTLTLEGAGTIVAAGKGEKHGKAAGIGGGYGLDCGNIVISVTGSLVGHGGSGCAGIGGGYQGNCGNITITSGWVTGNGGDEGAGIGSGAEGTCGNISIGNGITCVNTTCGKDCTNPIGAGKNGTCGTVTLDPGPTDTANGRSRKIDNYYIVRYNTPGGTADWGPTVSPEYKFVKKGGFLGELPEPEWYGYTFDGWYDLPEHGTKVTKFKKVTSDLDLYARWIPNYWTVTLKTPGGTAEWGPTVSPDTKVVEKGGYLGELPEPEWYGYTFDGWYNLPEYGTKATKFDRVTEDLVLYARWIPNYCTVTFKTPGGTAEWGPTVSPDTKVVEKGGYLGELPVPEWYGYTFDGWYDLPEYGSKVTNFNRVTEDLVLYARWIPNYCTVTFKVPGGTAKSHPTVSPASKVVEKGDFLGQLPVPEWEDHTFAGWYDLPEYGTEVTNFKRVNENLTLYARWTTPCYVAMETGDVKAPYAVPKAVALHGVAYDGCEPMGIVELKLGKVNVKKGTSKVSGSFVGPDGKKLSIKSATITGIDGTAPASVVLEVKGLGKMSVTIGGDAFAGSIDNGWHVQTADVGGEWAGQSATVTVDAVDISMFTGNVLADLLPKDETADVVRGKWSFAKAAGVKWAKPKKNAPLPDIYDSASGKGLILDTSKGKTNLSGLKLSYTYKKGTFKGSFKVYVLEGTGKSTKLKKYAMNVTGIVVDGVGYGQATCKKPAARWAVTIK